MAGQTIIITREDDGTYTVEVQEDAQHQAAERAAGMTEDDDGPKTVQSIDEVLAFVQQELSEDYGDDEGAEAQAWDQEAAGRDEAGYRKPGSPMMSLA